MITLWRPRLETDALSYDRNEISQVRHMELNALMKEINRNGHLYTPWLILAMEHLGVDRSADINSCEEDAAR